MPTEIIRSIASPSSTLSLTKVVQATSHAQAASTEAYYRFTAIPATIEARKAKCKDGFVLEQALYVLDVSTDEWTLFTCSPQPPNAKDRWTPGIVDFGTRYTQIIKTDFSRTWTIQHNLFDYSSINRPDAMLAPRRWTADGNYVYLVPIYYPGKSGGNQGIYFYDSNELYRLNLNSGDFEIVLPHTQWGYSYSLSPDDQYLAYSSLNEKSDEKQIVHIRNMYTGAEQAIKLNGNYTLTGAFAWEKDSAKLFFASALSGWENEKGGAASLFMLTLKNMYLQTVLRNDNRFLVPLPQRKDGNLNYWTNENYLYIASLNYETVEYFSDLALDVQSGNVIVLATPNPTLIGSATPKP